MRLLTAVVLFLVSASAFPDTVTRVIDTGPGLATVTRFNNGQIMVYDTGHWNHDNALLAAFQAFIGDHDIDLLIASHSDSDHVAATDELFNNFRIHRVIRTGFVNGAATWGQHNTAITEAANLGLTHDVNLANVTLPHGTVYRFGDATVTYLSGFHRPPDDWGIPASSSEFRNANSVVVRLEYEGNSVLFMGDAVGRVEGTADDTDAMGTEEYLIDNRVD